MLQSRIAIVLCALFVLAAGCDEPSVSDDGPDGGSSRQESDPIFSASPASSISESDIDAWNAAHGWGNHAEAGYLTSESDPSFTSSPASGITHDQIEAWNAAYSWGDHSTAGYLTSESDPLYSASPASRITEDVMEAWSAAYSWGDHSTAGYLRTEVDPAFSSSPAARITEADIAAWNAATSWGDHREAGYLTSEQDPSFKYSAASVIGSADIARWNHAFNSLASSEAGWVPVYDGSKLIDGSIYDAAGKVGVNVSAPPVAFFQVGDHVPSYESLDSEFYRRVEGCYLSVPSRKWQSFVVYQTGSLSKVAVYKNGCETPGMSDYEVEVLIYPDENVSAAPIGRGRIPMRPDACTGWFEIPLNEPAPVVAGQQYTMEVKSIVSLSWQGINIAFHSPTGLPLNPTCPIPGEDVYPYGRFWDEYGMQGDMFFRVYVSQEFIPPPVVVTEEGRVGINEHQPARSLHVRDVLRLEPRDVAPEDPQPGDIYFDANLARLRYFNGTNWVDL